MKKFISIFLVILFITLPVYADYVIDTSNNIKTDLENEFDLIKNDHKVIDIANVEKALNEVQYDFKQDYTVHIMDYRVRKRNLVGLALGKDEIVLFNLGRRSDLTKLYQEAVVHELGHLVYSSMTDEQRFEYFNIRDIPDDWGDSRRTRYKNRPSEIFAEDFRILFGNEIASEKYHMNRILKDPREVKGLKEFIERIGEND